MGNGDVKSAEAYFEKLLKITILLSSVWNVLILLLTPVFLQFYALQPETKQLVIWLVLIHNLFNALAYPFSGALSNGLRAAEVRQVEGISGDLSCRKKEKDEKFFLLGNVQFAAIQSRVVQKHSTAEEREKQTGKRKNCTENCNCFT